MKRLVQAHYREIVIAILSIVLAIVNNSRQGAATETDATKMEMKQILEAAHYLIEEGYVCQGETP